MRRIGIATFIAGLPLGVAIASVTEVHPGVTSMVVMGVGVIEYSLGVRGNKITPGPQG